MSSFSGILDVSSFFIGVLVNLLLVAMICFYFKRKIDNLELSQSEQAKILFQIVQDQSQPPVSVTGAGELYPVLNGLDLTQLGDAEESDTVQAQDGNQDEIEDSESSDSESDDDESDDENEIAEVKTIEYEELKKDDVESEPNDYSKFTVKELRNLLEGKGVQLNSSMKKQELIDLVTTTESQVIETVVKVDEENEITTEESSEEVSEETPFIETSEISEIHE